MVGLAAYLTANAPFAARRRSRYPAWRTSLLLYVVIGALVWWAYAHV
jgi:hypothetical protein